MGKKNTKANNPDDRMNPLSDLVFSWMFQNMESADAAKNLINAVLLNISEKPITEITEITSQYQQMGDTPRSKFGRLDVKAITVDGEKIDMEVQLTKQKFFVNRELFYGEKALTEDLKTGETYQNMPKTTLIAFTDFLVRNDNKDIVQPIKVAYLKNPIRPATDKIRIIIVQLPRFTNQYKTLEDVSKDENKDDALLQWLYVLTKGYQSEEEMDMVETRTAGVANFNALYNKAIADKTLRRKYEYELSVELDRNSYIQQVKDEGKVLGFIEALRDAELSDEVILGKIMKRFQLTETEAKEYLESVPV